MNKYTYDIHISAKAEDEADKKMEALTMLAKKLNAKELGKLSDVIENDPVKTALAKRALGL